MRLVIGFAKLQNIKKGKKDFVKFVTNYLEMMNFSTMV